MRNAIEKTAGFTLIEFIIVFTAIGILLAVAANKLIDLRKSATFAAQQGFSAEVRTALLQYYADNSNFPTVTDLADYMVSVGGSKVSAVASGVQVTINGSDYVVRTYSDQSCKIVTLSVSDKVKCVTDISS